MGFHPVVPDMHETNLNSSIKRIRGTMKNMWPQYIVFLDAEGNQVSAMHANHDEHFGPEQILLDGEEVIGVYGHKNSDGSGDFRSIGFIVWTPPDF
jgi:hypothetical protein